MICIRMCKATPQKMGKRFQDLYIMMFFLQTSNFIKIWWVLIFPSFFLKTAHPRPHRSRAENALAFKIRCPSADFTARSSGEHNQRCMTWCGRCIFSSGVQIYGHEDRATIHLFFVTNPKWSSASSGWLLKYTFAGVFPHGLQLLHPKVSACITQYDDICTAYFQISITLQWEVCVYIYMYNIYTYYIHIYHFTRYCISLCVCTLK